MWTKLGQKPPSPIMFPPLPGAMWDLLPSPEQQAASPVEEAAVVALPLLGHGCRRGRPPGLLGSAAGRRAQDHYLDLQGISVPRAQPSRQLPLAKGDRADDDDVSLGQFMLGDVNVNSILQLLAQAAHTPHDARDVDFERLIASVSGDFPRTLMGHGAFAQSLGLNKDTRDRIGDPSTRRLGACGVLGCVGRLYVGGGVSREALRGE